MLTDEQRGYDKWLQENIKYIVQAYIVQADFWPWIERAYKDGFKAAVPCRRQCQPCRMPNYSLI